MKSTKYLKSKRLLINESFDFEISLIFKINFIILLFITSRHTLRVMRYIINNGTVICDEKLDEYKKKGFNETFVLSNSANTVDVLKENY